MKNIVNDYVEKFRKRHRSYKKYMTIFAVLAVVTVVGVNWQLHQTGISMTADYQCGLEEHQHTEDCYTKTLTCGQEESGGENGHHHTEDCYTEELTCDLPEHTHTTECLIDTTADVETAEDWEATLPEKDMTGIWADDVVLIAQSQLGYTESESNFKIAEDGETRRGYTRYGEWAGDKYAEWSASFASFCLFYAGVVEEVFPYNMDCAEWIAQLDNQSQYRAAKEYEPKAGDLLFLDENEDGSSDHVGVITSVTSQGDMTVIEGDSSNKVEEKTYPASDGAVVGYGVLPDNNADDNKTDTQKKDKGDSQEETSGGSVEAKAAPDYLGSINTANQWQIVSEQYAGNAYENQQKKDTNGDGVSDLLYQKNVVPTGKENEFLVYLSMSSQMTWDEVLAESDFKVTTSNSYHSAEIGTIISNINGNSSTIYAGKGTTGRSYPVTVTFLKGGKTVHTYNGWYHGTTPNCKQGTGFLVLKTKSGTVNLVAVQSVNLKTTSTEINFTIDLDQMAKHGVHYSIDPIEFQSVSDQMGDYVVYDGVQQCDGTTSFDEGSKTLTWNPEENTEVTGISGEGYDGKTTGYHFNVCQLVYKVHLDVSKAGFDSCADNMNSKVGDPDSYKVNNRATLQYKSGSATGTVDYPVPYVRGLRYDVTFVKENEKGKRLKGAKFALYQEDGTTPVTDADGKPYEITTDTSTDVYRFSDLPYGTYVLKEIEVPKGYLASDPSSWTIPLCYTTDKSTLKQDDSPYQNNMVWTKNGSPWTIVNKKDPNYAEYSIEVVKMDQNGEPLKDVTFALTPVPEGATSEKTTDDNGRINYYEGFSANVEMALRETKTPDGYYSLPADIQFAVLKDNSSDTARAVLINESELGDAVTLSLKHTKDEDDEDVYKLTIGVKNTQGYVLPETGGTGTRWITLGGLLIVACALMYGHRRRRKQERGNN